MPRIPVPTALAELFAPVEALLAPALEEPVMPPLLEPDLEEPAAPPLEPPLAVPVAEPPFELVLA